MMRTKVEEKVADYLKVENIWKRYHHNYDEPWLLCDRVHRYGYGEYSPSYIYTLKDFKDEEISCYNEAIVCPCGCGEILPGSDDCNEDIEYNGEGFIYENFDITENYGIYCEYCGDYCEDVDCINEENCEGCTFWENAHPRCGLDGVTRCSCTNIPNLEVDDGLAIAKKESCYKCAHWKECQENDEEEDNSITVNYSSVPTAQLSGEFIYTVPEISYEPSYLSTSSYQDPVLDSIKRIALDIDNVTHEGLANIMSKLTDFIDNCKAKGEN